jgi:P-type Cu2+ transporter
MKNCLHCNQPVITNEKFCCIGCRSANYIINKLNLKDYYKYCRNIYNTSPPKVSGFENKINFIDEVINDKQGEFIINLLVDGIVCGSCVWLIENSLKSLKYITSVKFSLSTKRLEIIWAGEMTNVNKITNLILNLGYQISPYDIKLLDDQETLKEKELLKAIAVSGFASAQIMAFAFAVWIGNYNQSMGEYLRYIFHLVSGAIGVPSIIYSSRIFIISSYKALRNGRTNIDTPISISIIATLLISIQETIRMSEYVYYDASASLTFLLLVGRYLDLKARNKAKESIRNIMFQQPSVANLIKNDGVISVSAKSVKQNDLVVVRAGEKFPVDGVVVEGESEVDNSIISGESNPIITKKDCLVYAGTINLNNALKIKVKNTGEKTMLSEIIRLVENIEKTKSKFVKIADKLSQYFTPAIIFLALFTFIIWLKTGIMNATLNAVTLLIITCPCAVGLAVPMVQIIAFSKLIKQGIFIKKSDFLERVDLVDTIVFDKTGTLTYGKPMLLNFDEFSDEEKLLIASMASKSAHILCKAIVKNYKAPILDLEIKEVKGMGVYTKHQNNEIWLGNKRWCNIKNGREEDNYLEVWFKKDNDILKRIIFRDELRGEAKQVIRFLQLKYEVFLLSGDKGYNVKKVAEELNIKNYFGEKNYEQKHHFIQELSEHGKKVLMIGDGLNDSVALKCSYASCSPKTSIAISQDVSDAIYNGNLQSILVIFKASKLTVKLIKQNFTLSIIYNCLAVPFAMMGKVNPIIAAIFMSISSITVILNSLRFKIKED